MNMKVPVPVCSVAQSCLTLCDTMDHSTPQAPLSMGFSRKNTGVGSLSLLQGIFPTQELIQGLLHCRQILYQLSYEGSPSKEGYLLIGTEVLRYLGGNERNSSKSIDTTGRTCDKALAWLSCL